MTRRSIVPDGFDTSAHRIFSEYTSPLSLPSIITVGNLSNSLGSDDSIHLGRETPTCCPICLLTATDPVTLISCKHFFCKNCITKWFRTRVECPLCKLSCSHFIQASGNTKGQFNIWKTELDDRNSDATGKSTTDFNYDVCRAIEFHRSILSASHHRRGPMLPGTLPSPDETILHTESHSRPHQLTEAIRQPTDISEADPVLHHSDESDTVPGTDILSSNDLNVITEELRKLEDDLNAMADTG